MSKKRRYQSNSGLGDVAQHANVSATTVSRYFNAPEKVKASTKSRIKAAINDLGYVPNGAARTLASSRSHTIGAIVPTLDHALFARELSKTEERLAQNDYSLIVASSNYDPVRERELIQGMISRHVDGLVLVGCEREESAYALLERRRVPFVTTWVKSEKPRYPQIGVDNFKAACDVTEYLLDLNHQYFGAILLPSRNNDRAQARLAGIQVTLRQHNLAMPEHCIVERPANYIDSQIAIRHLLQQRPTPTAVICGSDVLAIGAILECKRLGVSIPDQLSIVSFDNTELASLIEPALTTVDLPVIETGYRAADYLLFAIKGQQIPIQSVLDYQLVVRKSAGKAPGLATNPFSRLPDRKDTEQT